MALQHLRSSTAHKRPIPTQLSAGQIAVNTNEASPGLFFKDSNGDLVKIGPVHVGENAPNSSPASTAATAIVSGTTYQILTVGTTDFTAIGASANTVGTIFTATGVGTGTGTVSGQQGVEKGEQWLDTTGGTYVLKIYDGSAWRSESGTFVDANGDTMTGALLLDNAASASAPDLSFDGDANTGIYSPGADQVAIATGGVGRLFVDSNGDVKIEDTSADSSAGPEFSLYRNSASPADGDYLGQIRFDGENDTGGKKLYAKITGKTSDVSNGSEDGLIETAVIKAGSQTIVSRQTGTDLKLINGTGLQVDGDVGIGTTSVDRILHIESAGSAEIKLTDSTNIGRDMYIKNNDGAFEFRSRDRNTNGTFVFLGYGGETDSEYARIDSSGRLLVGTSSVIGDSTEDAYYAKIVVRGNTASVNNRGQIALCTGAGSATLTNGEGIGRVVFADGDGGAFGLIDCTVDGTAGANDYPGRLQFSTTADGASSPTERMRISNDGSLNVFGTTSTVRVRNSNAAGTTNYLFLGYHSSTDIFNGTNSFRVSTNGNVTNTNNSYGAISDAKLKENIVDASSQWDDIKDLRVRNYNFIEGQTHTQIGVVAQEVETVSPGLVTESSDTDDEGNDLGTTTKSVNYSVLYMKAVKALQEAMDRIETLEAKVAALEAG